MYIQCIHTHAYTHWCVSVCERETERESSGFLPITMLTTGNV